MAAENENNATPPATSVASPTLNELAEATLPKDLSSILASIENQIKNTESVISESLKSTYALIDSARSKLNTGNEAASNASAAADTGTEAKPAPVNLGPLQELFESSSKLLQSQMALAEKQALDAQNKMAADSNSAKEASFQSAIEAVTQSIAKTAQDITAGIAAQSAALSGLQQQTPEN